MKHLFLHVLRTATVAETATETAPVFVPASSKLDELKALAKMAWGEMIKHEDPESKESKDSALKYFAANNAVKAEIAELTKLENDRITQEKRNERIKMNQSQLDAFVAYLTLKNDKKADPAKFAEAETVFNTSKELVENELLAKYAKSSSAKSGTTETSSGAAERDLKLWPLFAAGKKDKDVEAETGENRSNVWFSHDRYNKANSLGKYATS